ncbi:MAG: PilZ domain-containing protein [Proteobacteria bacterium]|nr:PilZ domain-containing protein [Pseudomonadota bacterium]MBU1715888.1 PilZ domain-containing protein [Pseudomonadota bacterium]
MEEQKVYVNQDNTAVITCPACEKVKSIQVQQFKGTKHILNARCSCQQVFPVRLEFRKAYRKEIQLGGDYVYWPSRNPRGKMRVLNVSITGIGMSVAGFHNIKVGHELEVKFNLDDKNNSEICRKVVVRLIEGNYIGCEFMESAKNDKALGFYLMP